MFPKIDAAVSNKYHVQLQKSIYCSEKSEGATIGILLKKTGNFIRKRLQYCEVYKNTRSSHQMCSIIKDVLINFAKFTGKHLCQSLFLNKVADLRPMICQGFSAIFIITKLQLFYHKAFITHIEWDVIIEIFEVIVESVNLITDVKIE